MIKIKNVGKIKNVKTVKNVPWIKKRKKHFYTYDSGCIFLAKLLSTVLLRKYVGCAVLSRTRV